MDCPDCGGPMWDNRQTKKNPKQPDYKCKDKDGCGKGVWEQRKNGNGNGAPANGTAAADRAKRPLGRLYFESMRIAAATVKQHLGDKASPADIIAATATLFIGATNTGAPLVAPQKPKPVPPPPPREPDPEPDYEDPDDGLPF